MQFLTNHEWEEGGFVIVFFTREYVVRPTLLRKKMSFQKLNSLAT